MLDNKTRVNAKDNGGFAYHLMMGVFTNLTAAFLVAGVYFFEKPILKLLACLGALLVCGVLLLVTKWIKSIWENIKHIGYYFLPTTFIFLALAERRRRLAAEEQIKSLEAKIERLEEIISFWRDPSIIGRIIDPRQQEESLKEIINEMDEMPDSRLAIIVDRIRHYLGDILSSVGHNGNYNLLRQLISRLSSYEPSGHPESYTHFLWLLSDIFGMSPSDDLNKQLQQDMMGPLKQAISQVDERHRYRIGEVIAKIMADEKDEHEFARDIAEMLLRLDWEKQLEICQIIFNEGKKRAFRFPQHFGFDFLNVLRLLEHKIFWLDMQSLRDLLEESLNDNRKGLINSNPSAYEELCAKVFAPLEYPDHKGLRHARIFRRLVGDDGRVKVECVFPGGKVCNCEGESLSFRGLYSRDCIREAGERFKSKIIPLLEVKSQFPMTVSVAAVHTDEYGNQVQGRGIFFEEAEEPVVKDLYEFISKGGS